jgi:hypothetical protein
MLNPVQIVGIRQPRCDRRFGVGACTASGTKKCYQTWPTCPVQDLFRPDGSIEWLFVASRPGIWALGDFADANNIRTNCIPVDGLSVSTSKAQVNAAGVLEGKSPFGVHATCTVTMRDRMWDDHVGDFYLGDRATLPQRNFWAVWAARNLFMGGMELVIYEGYEGQALSAFRQRLYVLGRVDGPDGDGKVTISGVSPLMEAEGKKALFPAAMDVRLVSDIDTTQTTIRLTTIEDNLTRAFGISARPGLIIGSEIMLYTGYSEIEPGVYDLAVIRHALKTTAAAAKAGARAQRIGYFEDTPTWECGKHILTEHSPVTAGRLDLPMWEEEGGDYLATIRSTTVIPAPTPVFDLMGEICQQGMFFVWWNEYAAKVKMQAVRPPAGAVRKLTGAANIVGDSARVTRAPESTLTRVFVYYGQKDPTKTDKANYLVIDGTIEASNEDPRSGGQARTLEISARWVNTAAHAQQIISRILSRYRSVPRFLTIRVSEQDKDITIGDVCDVTQRQLVDDEGRLISSRWQVISWDEVKPGEIYALDLQTYDLIGRFGGWMADDGPDYDDATEEERGEGAWWAGDDGLMPDGSDGYQWS